jgi:hypothetical protein
MGTTFPNDPGIGDWLDSHDTPGTAGYRQPLLASLFVVKRKHHQHFVKPSKDQTKHGLGRIN